MTTEYSRPRQRARSFGAGVLSGNAVAQDGVMEQLQSNIQFRLQSVRGMLMGQGGQDSLSPLERRQEIRNRRQELLGQMGGPLGGSSDGSSGTSSATGGSTGGSSGSGSIGTSGTTHSKDTTSTRKDSTPSMSEVDKGTKKRAEERN